MNHSITFRNIKGIIQALTIFFLIISVTTLFTATGARSEPCNKLFFLTGINYPDVSTKNEFMRRTKEKLAVLAFFGDGRFEYFKLQSPTKHPFGFSGLVEGQYEVQEWTQFNEPVSIRLKPTNLPRNDRNSIDIKVILGGNIFLVLGTEQSDLGYWFSESSGFGLSTTN